MFDWRTVEVPQMVEALKEVGNSEEVVEMDGATGRRIPEHPMLSDDAMGSFVTSGMALRKFMVEEICPAVEIESEGLREGASTVTVVVTVMVVVILNICYGADVGPGRALIGKASYHHVHCRAHILINKAV